MRLPKELIPPSSPHLALWILPPEELEAASSLRTILALVDSNAAAVGAAIALHQFCEQGHRSRSESRADLVMPNEDPYFRWIFTAARDGGICLYNYAKAMAGARSTLGLCPTLLPLVDAKGLREIEKEFGTVFGFNYDLRQSIAHSSELWEHPEKAKKNQDKTGITKIGWFNGNVFENTYEGATIRLPMTTETGVRLNDITGRFFNCFEGATAERHRFRTPVG